MEKQKQWLPYKTLWLAYEDCRKHKRNTHSCAEFEFNEAQYTSVLWKDLNYKTYEIGYSTAFAVTRPKLREVFAADFRDRIVHHLIIMKTLPLFESNFITDTYNCRINKGTLYGIKRISEKIQQKDNCWVLKLDLQGFFMSIDKQLLRDRLKKFFFTNYKSEDINEIWWLIEMNIMHNPERKCIIKGDKRLLDALPPEKSLLKGDGTKGLAIGNLTSQIFANFYLCLLDEYLSTIPNIEYGRYVDDFILIGNKEKLLTILQTLQSWLWKVLKVKLHPNKTYLQHYTKGVAFVGAVIKPNRTYINNRTVGNCITLIKQYNKLTDEEIENDIERFAQRYNAYLGFMIHHKSYAIRYKLWNMIDNKIKRYIYITNSMQTLKVRNKYKYKNKLLKQYGNKSNYRKRRICYKKTNVWHVDRSRKTQ